MKQSRVEIELEDVDVSPSKLKKPKSILSKRNLKLDELTDSDLSSEKQESEKYPEIKKAESVRDKKKKGALSSGKKKKPCKSERVVRFHEDLEAEGGDDESSNSSMTNQYGNKTPSKKGQQPSQQSGSDKSVEYVPGFFAKLFNFNNNLKFEDSLSKSNSS